MKISDFDYHLPEELIAQKPADKRDCSRLLVVHRDTGAVEHRHFFDILDYLKEGDSMIPRCFRPGSTVRRKKREPR